MWTATRRWSPICLGSDARATPVENRATGELGYAKVGARGCERVCSELARIVGVMVPEVRLERSEPHGGGIAAISIVCPEDMTLWEWRVRMQLRTAKSRALRSVAHDITCERVLRHLGRARAEPRGFRAEAAACLALAGVTSSAKPTRDGVELYHITFAHEAARFLHATPLLDALRQASGILVFFAWIGAEDLKEDNLLVHRYGSELQIRAIDFDARAFTGIESAEVRVPWFVPIAVVADRATARAVVERIERLSLRDLEAIVDTIPIALRSADLPPSLPERLFRRARLLRRLMDEMEPQVGT